MSPDMFQPKTDPLFDRPLWRDWTAWLGAVAIIAALAGLYGNDYRGNVTSSFDLTAFAIDALLSALFQWLVFAVVPAAVRRAIRRRRAVK